MQFALPLILLWLAHFIVDFMLGIWSVYKTISFFDLGIAGAITSFAALTGEGSQLIFGNLGDRGFCKRLIVFGVVMVLANALLPFTSSYLLVLALFCCTCMGSGAFHPCAVAHIGGLTDRQKGLFISIFASGGALGMALSQFVFSETHAYFEGNTLILAVPSLLLGGILILFGYMKKENPNASPHSHQLITFGVIKEYFKDKPLRLLYISQVCNQMIFWGSIFLLPDVLISRGYDESIAYGGGHMAFVIGSAFTMIPSGYLADRFSARTIICAATFFGMFFYYAFLLIPTLPPVYLLASLLISGSFIGIVQPLAVALGNDLGRKNPGLVGAFTMGLVWCVSETLGPVGMGFASKLFVEDAPAKALMLLGALFPILLITAYQLPQGSQEETLEIQP